MSNGGFVYRSQREVPQIGGISIRPVEVPDLHTNEGLGRGLQILGEAGVKFAKQRDVAQQATRQANATTEFLTGLDAAETTAVNNPDYETAPVTHRATADQLEKQAIAAAKQDPEGEARLRLILHSHAIASNGRVETAALKRHIDANTAALDGLELQLSAKATNAKSDIERKIYTDQMRAQLDDSVKHGLVDASKAEVRWQRFSGDIAIARVVKTIREDPAGAVKLLDDPANFPEIPPPQRESLRNAAENAADQAATDKLASLASGPDSWRVTMQTNHLQSPEHISKIFDNVTLPLEGGGPVGIGGRLPFPVGGSLAGKSMADIARSGGAPGSRDYGGGRPGGTYHTAVDIGGQVGDPLLGVMNGGVVVRRDASRGGYGNVMDIRYPDGTVHRMAHLAGFGRFHVGDRVQQGDIVGYLGHSGNATASFPHVHYEVIRDAAYRRQHGRPPGREASQAALEADRIDPRLYFGSAPGGAVSGGSSMPSYPTTLGRTSPAGALGVSQIKLPAARESLTDLGMTDIANLSDAELTERLLKDHKLNYTLGLHYFTKQFDAFDGVPAYAGAAYNGGPTVTRIWREKAIEKFGPNPTPQQFASVIDKKETRDYVLKMFGQAQTPPTGSGVSENGRYQAQAKVDGIIRAQESRDDQVIKQLAGYQRTQYDWLGSVLKHGGAPPPEVQQVLQVQQQAAAAGSEEAAAFVQKIVTGLAAKPYIDQAKQQPPAILDSAVATLEAKQATTPLTSEQRIQLKAWKTWQESIKSGRDEDPIKLAVAGGRMDDIPIDPRVDLNDAAAVGPILATRSAQALAAFKLYGGTLKPLHTEDVPWIKQRILDAPSTQAQLGMLRTMAASMAPEAYHATLAQLGLPSELEVAGKIAVDAPALGQKVLDGGKLALTPGVEKPVAALRTQLQTLVKGNLFPAASSAMPETVDASLAVYAANAGSVQKLGAPPDEDLMRTSLEEVVGKLGEYNGRPVASPIGWSAEEMHDLVSGINDAELKALGGAVDSSNHPVDAASLIAHGQLVQKTPRGNDYYVVMPNPSAPDGFDHYFQPDPKNPAVPRPLVIDMTQFARLRHMTAAGLKRERPISPTIKDLEMPTPVIGLGAMPDTPVIGLDPMTPPLPAAPLEGSPEQLPPLEKFVPSLTPGVPGEVNIPGEKNQPIVEGGQQ